MSYPLNNQYSETTPEEGQFAVPIGYQPNNIPKMPDNYTITYNNSNPLNQYQNQPYNFNGPRIKSNYTHNSNSQIGNSALSRNVSARNYQSNLNDGQKNNNRTQQQHLVEELRPYYQKKHTNDRSPKASYHHNNSNNSGVNQQSSKKSVCCSPIVLIILGIIAIIGITLGLIFGLNNKSGDSSLNNASSHHNRIKEGISHNKVHFRNYQLSHNKENFKYNYQ